MPTTSNHEIQIPPSDDEAWAAKLVHDLEYIETALPVFDAAGTIDGSVVESPHTPHEGAWLLARDTGALFTGDGAAWTQRGGVPRTTTASATGDGTTTTFVFEHSVGTDPAWVGVTPTTAAAGARHHVAETTSVDVTVEYASAPADGATLAWDLAMIAGPDPVDETGGSA